MVVFSHKNPGMQGMTHVNLPSLEYASMRLPILRWICTPVPISFLLPWQEGKRPVLTMPVICPRMLTVASPTYNFRGITSVYAQGAKYHHIPKIRCTLSPNKKTSLCCPCAVFMSVILKKPPYPARSRRRSGATRSAVENIRHEIWYPAHTRWRWEKRL